MRTIGHRLRAIARFALAWLFLSTGVMHFARPHGFVRIVPPYFPEPALLVALSGAAEIVLAVALLVPRTRRLAAIGLIALLIAVVPANVNMALHPENFRDIATPTFFWLRVPFQLVFIAAAAWTGDLLGTSGALRSRTVSAASVLVAIATIATVAVAAFAWRTVGPTAAVLPLAFIADVPLTGGATRFDYASMDDASGTLWLAHMGDGSVEGFDVARNRVRLTIPIAPNASVRGILAVRGKVYAAAQGLGAVVVLDATTGKRLATISAGDVDGLAYDPITQRVFVSDEAGSRDVAIDTRTDRAIGAVPLGGDAGNTQYDAGSHHIFVGVETRDELAEIDPRTLTIVRRLPVPGCWSSHSVAIDARRRAAYVGCEFNVRLVRVDLRDGHATDAGGVGIGVDVLALDPARHRLYVASESGVACAYDVGGKTPKRLARAFVAFAAHVVAVDPATHRVYFPLQNVGGKPMLREMAPH